MRNHYCEKEKEGSGLKKTTILIIAFSVCILLFATYFIISSLPEKNDGQDYEEESAYLYVDQTDVESVIGFSFIGGEYDLSFEKDKDGCWKYTKNLSLPVNGELIDRLLSDYELFLATKSLHFITRHLLVCTCTLLRTPLSPLDASRVHWRPFPFTTAT